MFEMHTEIEIEARPEIVWQVLTDTNDLGSWNPFIHRMEGVLEEGRTIRVEVGAPGHSRMRFRPRILKFDPGKELRWRGKLVMPGLFDGEHVFELRQTPHGTHFVHREEFSGLLVPLLRRVLERDTKPGFEAMNQALKERSEARELMEKQRSGLG